MVTFRSNNNNSNRRPPFRNNNRRPPFRNNNEGSKFSNNDNFRRNVPGRNNNNAVKLIEKYNNLANEALTSGDRVLSENYFQHADHFTRVQNEQESIRMARVNSSIVEKAKPEEAKSKDENSAETEKDELKEIISGSLDKKAIKTPVKKIEVKKSVAS